jgi:hypothetical protein
VVLLVQQIQAEAVADMVNQEILHVVMAAFLAVQVS